MTTAATTTLAAWLLDRIAEDEATARYESGDVSIGLDQLEVYSTLGGANPARVLAECESKKAIVRDCEEVVTARWITDRVLMHLAQPYASHPDFDPSWRA